MKEQIHHKDKIIIIEGWWQCLLSKHKAFSSNPNTTKIIIIINVKLPNKKVSNK
jgi:hypothetical protein